MGSDSSHAPGHLLNRWRRFLEGAEAVQDMVAIDGGHCRYIGVRNGPDDHKTSDPSIAHTANA